MNEKVNMKFIKTSDQEMIKQLRISGFTEIGETNDGVHCFVNDGRKLMFDTEKYKYFYTNILHL